jgi:hypothetical protein
MKLREMQTRVDAAIAELNAGKAKREVLIAWGGRSKEDERKQRKRPAKDRMLSALITFDSRDGWDIEADLFHPGPMLLLCAYFDNFALPRFALPRRNARKLYNLLSAIVPDVRLCLFPDGREIAVFGVETHLPASRVTGRHLDDAFLRLLGSADAVQRILHDEDGPKDDAWGRDDAQLKS